MLSVPSLSLIIPVHNERQLLRASVGTIDAFVQKHFSDYEILIIESGSTDGTGKISDELAREFPRVQVFHEGARNGFGSALKLGYKNATKDLVWMVTADLPFPLESILQALPLLSDYDVVLSSRASDDRGFSRKILSFGYNTLMKNVLNLKVKHINSAFKLFKRPLIQSLPLSSNGWFMDAEILYWLGKRKVKTIEIPVPLIDRTVGQSSVSSTTPFSMVWEALKLVCKNGR